jgi:hypothetical protein
MNRDRITPFEHRDNIIACIDNMVSKKSAQGLKMDPQLNKTGKWSCLLRAREELLRQGAEIKRLRVLLRIAGIKYTPTGGLVYEDPSLPLPHYLQTAEQRPERA